LRITRRLPRAATCSGERLCAAEAMGESVNQPASVARRCREQRQSGGAWLAGTCCHNDHRPPL